MSAAVSKLRFPVLCYNQGHIQVAVCEDDLTTCNKLGLKNGWFRGLTIVDSEGTQIKIREAIKLHGLGFFWGYNIFLNQRIKVALQPMGQPTTIPVGEVRNLVLQSLNQWPGWRSRGDFNELLEKVSAAQSIPELIGLIVS